LLSTLFSATGLATFSTETVTFDQYVAEFQRTYQHGSEEYSSREKLFQQRLADVRQQNSKPNRLWTAGLNHLTDRTHAELQELRGWRRSVAHPGSSGTSLLSGRGKHIGSLASEVDWKNVTAVVDQGSCGSCWAVATKALLDAHYAIHMNEETKFSAQELVNCVPNPESCGGSGGCGGATVELAMQYVQGVGLSTESEVPYRGSDGSCKRPASSSLFQSDGNGHDHGSGGSGLKGLHSWETLESNKAEPLMRAVQNGPVAISAGADGWYSYYQGVFDSCSKDAVIDHAILLVGYGEDKAKGANYWTVQNSWGRSWGENGFIRIKRGATTKEDEEHCGTDDRPGDGIACMPYPLEVKVCGMCGMLYDSVAPQFSAASFLQMPKGRRDGFLSL
jgi:cathepsin L